MKKKIFFNKKIIIGVCGSISVYKIPDLIRKLKNHGAIIRVIMTKSAESFITPLTFQVVSGNSVFFDVLDLNNKFFINHIELAKWADLVILVPTTANLIAKLSVGISDDLLTALCLTSNNKIAIVPSMNKQMYQANITQENIDKLDKRGFYIWGPDYGKQICGDVGFGRMLGIFDILDQIESLFIFKKKKDMVGLKLLITAGPTQEKIDPFRFISNYSSGKMGFSIAKAAAFRGAKVTLISGPVKRSTPFYVNRINTSSSLEMFKLVKNIIKDQEIFISCAAVSDYRPKVFFERKIKSDQNNMELKLIKNPDILKNIGELKNKRPYIVGFSAETGNLKKYAKLKLFKKNADMICANNILLKDSGFGSENNELYLYWRNKEKYLSNNNKLKISHYLLTEILRDYEEKNKN